MPENHSTAREAALVAARAADDKKATDILVQDVRGIVSMTDFFVIATAANDRQVAAVIDSIEEACRVEAGRKPLHREAAGASNWSLLDYGDFIVHVFQPEAREYYRLEALWSEAALVDLKEAGIDEAAYSERIAQFVTRAGEESAEEPASQGEAGEEAEEEPVR